MEQLKLRRVSGRQIHRNGQVLPRRSSDQRREVEPLFTQLGIYRGVCRDRLYARYEVKRSGIIAQSEPNQSPAIQVLSVEEDDLVA